MLGQTPHPLELAYEDCRQAVLNHNYSQGVIQAKLVIEQAQSSHNSRINLKAHAQLQYCYTMLGQSFDAYQTITQALVIAESLNDNVYLGYLHFEAGLTLNDLSYYELAVQHIEKSRQFYGVAGEFAKQNLATYQQAVCFRKMGLYEESLKLLKQVSLSAEQLEQSDLVIDILNEMGLVAYNKGDHGDALVYFDGITTINTLSAEQMRDVMYAFYNCAKIYLDEGNTEQAKESFLRAYQVRHPSWVNTEPLVYHLRNQLYALDESKLALLKQNDVPDIAPQLEDAIRQSYEYLTQHFQSQGLMDSALIYSQKINTLAQARLHSRTEIERLYNLYRVKAMQLESQNQALRDNRDFMNLLWGLCLGVLVTAAAAIIIFYYRRNRRFENQHRKMEAVFSKYS